MTAIGDAMVDYCAWQRHEREFSPTMGGCEGHQIVRSRGHDQVLDQISANNATYAQ